MLTDGPVHLMWTVASGWESDVYIIRFVYTSAFLQSALGNLGTPSQRLELNLRHVEVRKHKGKQVLESVIFERRVMTSVVSAVTGTKHSC